VKFRQAFGIEKGDHVALIGAGGKTSLMVGIGYELAELGWRVLATSTTPMPLEKLDLMPAALPVDTPLADLSAALTEARFVFLYGEVVGEVALGVPPAQVTGLPDMTDADVLLVEADRAGNLPLKAPLDGEPLLPEGVSLVIPVASFAAVGQPLDAEHIYNPEAMVRVCGFPEGLPVKPAWIAQVIRDEQLGMKGVPPHVRAVAFLNQTPMTPFNRRRARAVAKLALLHSTLKAVALGEVRGHEPVREVQRVVGAVVLAAGASRRMGEPKLLLPWLNGRTIIEHTVEQLVKLKMEPIVVVTGHDAREVRGALERWEVQFAQNRAYKTAGLGDSLRAGLTALPTSASAALVVLGDQPNIPPKVVQQVLMAYAEHQSDLVVPTFDGQAGYPVLVARRHWPDVLTMKDDAAFEGWVRAHLDAALLVSVDTDAVLRSVDTPQDYREAKARAGLR
jgi:molybdenum cofactor cytidylyltransferase